MKTRSTREAIERIEERIAQLDREIEEREDERIALREELDALLHGVNDEEEKSKWLDRQRL